ncbi:MAG: CYTH domain-containing protein [Eubacteriales bacterium]|nr:CYTH domain-containing protein [Eubacteriales bacterium]
MEIERKWLLNELPENISCNLNNFTRIEMTQAYLCRNPVIRVRKENDIFVLTYKGSGYKVREEYNLSLNEAAFNELLPKCSGKVIQKSRYLIPLDGELTAELDIFELEHKGLILLEVEFKSESEADAFEAPTWFGTEVTGLKEYTNSYLSS